MNWQNIQVSEDNTHFLLENELLFGTYFKEVLKFHSPGLAPVMDDSGSYHINCEGKELYANRYARTFGFYCLRAAVIEGEQWFHIDDRGLRVYEQGYSWVGNYQEYLCTVRLNNKYFHIDLEGNRIYRDDYVYCGDFKDGIACVKSGDGLYRHIDKKGNFINTKSFFDLGVFHKNFATAKDAEGWHHIDRFGNPLYRARYAAVEPFYNGFALVTKFDNTKAVIDEKGEVVMGV